MLFKYLSDLNVQIVPPVNDLDIDEVLSSKSIWQGRGSIFAARSFGTNRFLFFEQGHLLPS